MQQPFRRSFATSLAVSIGLLLFVALLTLVFGSRIVSASSRVRETKQEIVRRFQAIQSLAVLTNEANKAEPYEATLATLLPPQDKLINFSKDVKALAAKRKLPITFIFKDAVPASQSALGYINFQLSLTGERDQILSFVGDLEGSNYIVAVDTLDFRASGKSSTLSLTGRVFSR
jgi:Tfp pilus assembly protein PilO